MKYISVENVGFSNQQEHKVQLVPVGNQSITFEIPYVEQEEITEFINLLKSRKAINQSVIQRANNLLKVVDLLLRKKNEIIDAVCVETGKSKALSESEFNVATEFMISLAGLAKFSSGTVIPSVNPQKNASYERVPYGIASLIVSFNTPLPNYAWKVAPSYLVGNTSILKPSPFTPLSAQLFVDSFSQVLGESNSIFLLQGGSDQGRYLLAAKPDLISFTGSFETGVLIQEQIKGYSPKVILELGGNNSFIVFSDVDIDQCVETAFQSAYSNSGQRCAAGSRIFLEKSISHDFISKLKKRVIETKAGIGIDFEIGPVISESSYQDLERFLKNCSSLGLPIHQASSSDADKLFFNPTLVEISMDKLSLMNDELFGPIARVCIFDSEEEVVNLANSTKNSLTAAVWTNDLNRALRVSRAIRSGIVNINGPTHGAEFQFPFGGFESSGNGAKEVGYQCLDQYSFSKLTTITYRN